jgi:hypothetical protein
VGTCRVLFLGCCLEELPGGLGVADGGLGVEAEHGGQVQRVWSPGESLLELAIDAQAVEGRGLAAELLLGKEERADRTGRRRRLLVDEQVRVRGARPAGAPVVEPFQQDPMGELVDRADAAGDGESPVAEVDVLEAQLADCLGAGGVDGCEDQDQPIGWGLGDLDCLVDVVLAEGWTTL